MPTHVSWPEILRQQAATARVLPGIGWEDRVAVLERMQAALKASGWGDDAWDRQMKADAATGKFDALNRDADTAHTKGETRSLGEILREP